MADGHHFFKYSNYHNSGCIWLVLRAQVSEVYQLRRETFHAAVDFVDRYLSRTSDITKRQLQLVGTAALFVAAKVEVTDSAR